MAILIDLLAFAMLTVWIIVLCLMIEALCDLLNPSDAIAHSGRLGAAHRIPVPRIA